MATAVAGFRAEGVRTKPSVVEGIVSARKAGNIQHIVYEPGNGTSYAVLLTPCEGLGIVGTGDGKDYTMVTLVEWGVSYALPNNSAPHPAYIREKFPTMRPMDSIALWELFVWLFEQKNISGPPKPPNGN
jgi:hypothetical protein